MMKMLHTLNVVYISVYVGLRYNVNVTLHTMLTLLRYKVTMGWEKLKQTQPKQSEMIKYGKSTHISTTQVKIMSLLYNNLQQCCAAPIVHTC